MWNVKLYSGLSRQFEIGYDEQNEILKKDGLDAFWGTENPTMRILKRGKKSK